MYLQGSEDVIVKYAGSPTMLKGSNVVLGGKDIEKADFKEGNFS